MENRIKHLDNSTLLALAAQNGYAIIDTVKLAKAAGVGVRSVRAWLAGKCVQPATHRVLSETLGLSTNYELENNEE